MAGAIYQTKLTADTTQHDQALGRSANQVYNYKRKCEDTDKGVKKLFGSFTKLAGAFSAVKVAGDLFNGMMKSNQGAADNFNSTMEAARTITDEFAYSISNFDFSNMFNGLGSLISRATEYYNALDNLQTLQLNLMGTNAKLDAELAGARRRVKEGDLSAVEDIKRIGAQMEANVKAEQDAIKKMLEARVRKDISQSTSAGHYHATYESSLSMDDIKYYTSNLGELDGKIAQLKQAWIDLKEKASEYNKDNIIHYQVARAEAEYKAFKSLYDKYGDGDNLREFNEQYAKFYQLDKQFQELQQRNLRYLNETSKSNKTVTVTPKVIPVKPDEVLPEGSIAELEKRLSDLKIQWRMATSDQQRSEIKKTIDEVQSQLDVIMGVEKKPKVEVAIETEPVEGSMTAIKKQIQILQSQLENTNDPNLRIKIRIEIEKLNEQMDSIAEAMKTPSEKMQEQIQNIQDKYNEMGTVSNSVFSSVGSIFSTLANTSDENTNKMLRSIGTIISSIGQMIPKILALVAAEEADALAGGTASAAKLPYPANIAAIASIVAEIIGVIGTITSLSSSAKYATGGIVGGSHTIGDFEIARVNAGEMILNRTQQRHLFDLINGSVGAMTNGGSMKGDVTFRISGSDLIGVLSNYDRSSRRIR